MTGFDTLAAAEALEAAGMEPKQARACAAQMRAASIAGRAELATKAGIAELRAGFAESKAEILKRMVGVAAGQTALIVALMKRLP